jgi:CRISPR/Cas system-associated endonuclease Cas1
MARNSTWSRDKLILALDLYLRHRERLPDSEDAEIVELSQTLNSLFGEQASQQRGCLLPSLEGNATSLEESARHPVADDWRSVASRTSRFNLAGNRNASHPVNAILNYAYAVLQSQIQIKAVAKGYEGYDPMLGIMHYERDDSPAFVFDMMEPERPKVDRAVLAFIKSEALHPADFTIKEDSVVRLNPELARRVVGLAA